MFSALDWAVVAVYFAVMASIGIVFSKKNRNFSDFMFGGGGMPWLTIGISLIATSISASTFLGNPAESFQNDLRLLMLNVGSICAIFIIGAVFIPRYKASGITSAYELLERRFSPAIRRLAAGFYTCHLLMRLGMLMFGPSLVIKAMLGIPIPVSIAVMAIGSILYTLLGGIRAIAWTDVLQFSIFMGSGLVVIFYVSHASGGLAETFRHAYTAGKLTTFDTTFDVASARNLWTAGFVYIVFEVAIRGCDQQFVQRYLSCKSAREANLSSVASVLLGLCVGTVFYLVGACLYVYFNVKGVSPLPAGLSANEVFPYFIMNILPTGLKGLLGAAILGEAMSSLNSAYSALSNTTVSDLLHKPGQSPNLTAARKWILIWGLVGTGIAFICSLGSQSLLTKALFFTSLFTGPLLGLFLLAFFRPHLHPRAVFISAFVGMAGLMLFLDIPVLPKGLWTPLYTFAWPFNPLISLSFTLVSAHLLSWFFNGKKASLQQPG